MRKVIWLYGENEGRTLNNNSFYFWRQVATRNDEIDKYIVAIKNENNKKVVKSLSKDLRKKVLWKNSLRHWIIFFKSNTHIVSLSYKDVTPSFLKKTMNITKPIIYLQHGTLAIKKIGYTGDGYHNKFLRFFIYNPKMMETFRDVNNFKEYQLYYAKYHPRYMELVRRNNLKKKNRQFLYFLTWREYFGNNKATKQFIDNITKIVLNKKLIKYLKDNNIKFKLCVHQFFDEEKLKTVYEKMDREVFEIVTPSKIDVMDELAYSELLITDFSSVGFDFTFLNKPVLLFAPDFDEYLKGRDLYCSKEELKSNMYLDIDSLVDKITSGKYEINKFFKSRLPKDIDHDYVLKGKHIDDIYNYLKNMELNKVIFLGYKFGGRGGSVSATKSLAEGLLEKGYYVELVSLKGELSEPSNYPFGLRDDRITFRNRLKPFRIYDRICIKLSKFHIGNKGSLKYDNASKFLPCNIKNRTKRYLNKTTARTVVSTRESLHEYVCNIKNPNVKNKVCFFHTDCNALDNLFPKIDRVLDKYDYDKMVFVSKTNKEKYNEKFNFKYNKQVIIGNSLTSDKIINREDIRACGKKDIYKGICLLRLAQDRKKDLDNIISFGKKLKDKKCNKFVIDVYGNGVLEDYFVSEIKKNKLSKIIKFCGLTDDTFGETQKHDFIIDFSIHQSFGMIYLEGVLAGKKLYASNNDGSREVLSKIKENIYKDEDDLFDKLNSIDKVTTSDLVKYYDIIMKDYGPEKMADDFAKMLK